MGVIVDADIDVGANETQDMPDWFGETCLIRWCGRTAGNRGYTIITRGERRAMI